VKKIRLNSQLGRKSSNLFRKVKKILKKIWV